LNILEFVNHKGHLFMEIEGTYTLQATPEEVWQYLIEPQTFLHTLSEIEQLERIDEHTHALAIHITYAPLAGTYYGHIRVVTQHYPRSYRIIINHTQEKQNTFSGEISVDLQSHEDTTIVTYKGSIQLNKVGARLQATVVRGAVKLLAQQFFTMLAEQLWQQRATKNTVEVEEEIINIVTVQRSPAAPHPHINRAKRQAPTLLHRIVHLLRLGKGNPVQEERWTQRIRRTSYASMLLFLVWVGTRIPRR
jgi:carbon monoxide dehydrogenase subunit G